MRTPLISLVSHLGNFVADFPTAGKAQVRNVPSGPYEMVVSLDGDDLHPDIVFSLRNEKDQRVIAEKHLDYVGFNAALDARYVEYTLNKTFTQVFLKANKAKDENAMRASWRVEELKSLLGDRIEGNAAFWSRLGHDIEKILEPVGIAMAEAEYARTDEALLENPTFGMRLERF